MKKESFNSIYEKYHKLSLKVAFNIVQDMHLAMDVCQEVFVLLYEKMDGLDEELIKYWIVVNSSRKAKDLLRKLKRQGAITEKLQFTTEFVGNHIECLTDNILRREFITKIFAELYEKNPVWWDLCIRIYIENEDPKQVAEVYHISLASLRMKLHRANKWIRKQYAKEYDNLSHHRDVKGCP